MTIKMVALRSKCQELVLTQRQTSQKTWVLSKNRCENLKSCNSLYPGHHIAIKRRHVDLKKNRSKADVTNVLCTGWAGKSVIKNWISAHLTSMFTITYRSAINCGAVFTVLPNLSKPVPLCQYPVHKPIHSLVTILSEWRIFCIPLDWLVMDAVLNTKKLCVYLIRWYNGWRKSQSVFNMLPLVSSDYDTGWTLEHSVYAVSIP